MPGIFIYEISTYFYTLAGGLRDLFHIILSRTDDVALANPEIDQIGAVVAFKLHGIAVRCDPGDRDDHAGTERALL